MRSLSALLLAALLAAACNGSAGPTPATSAVTEPSVVADTEPPPSAEPSAPPATEEPTPSTPASETPTPPAEVTPGPSASAGAGPAAACSGSAENRDFFRAAASVLAWPVYCAVLPAGWFVDSGQYRQASGGWVQIAYKGPGGARLELHEGAFCTADDGCVPPGTDSGQGAFGDRTGTLVALDDGDFAVVVDRAKAISWLAVGTGMDEAAFVKISAALALVGG